MNNESYRFYKEIELKNKKNLVIRNPIESDAENMITYLNIVGGETDNLLFRKGSIHFNPEEEKEFIRNINNNKNSLMLLGFINDNLVSMGDIISDKKICPEHNSTIAISVRKFYWKMGIASSIMKELINFAINNAVIKNINLGVKAENTNAIKLYKKLGFEEIGINKNYFNVEGIYYDQILMALYL
jgi:RimJ/RimL family protein N-acetyltransferase